MIQFDDNSLKVSNFIKPILNRIIIGDFKFIIIKIMMIELIL